MLMIPSSDTRSPLPAPSGAVPGPVSARFIDGDAGLGAEPVPVPALADRIRDLGRMLYPLAHSFHEAGDPAETTTMRVSASLSPEGASKVMEGYAEAVVALRGMQRKDRRRALSGPGWRLPPSRTGDRLFVVIAALVEPYDEPGPDVPRMIDGLGVWFAGAWGWRRADEIGGSLLQSLHHSLLLGRAAPTAVH